ncbi:unnamed protein product [Linum tenue]|uniref:UspA domain-containing protein n=1 Tax=Linum tenue TaxID=586396 RepID=A0AAV0L253_9ROSI|nr:unnamed protein product [Linum tenue]
MGKDKTIGVAMDFSTNSKNALKWALDNLADRGDTIYIIHVHSNELPEGRNELWGKAGSLTKLYWGGDARDRIVDAVEGLKLDSVVMGSRGLGTVKRSVRKNKEKIPLYTCF